MWNDAEYLFMQSTVESELNDIVKNVGEVLFIVMCISRHSLVKV
jgi:hypothetical protein